MSHYIAGEWVTDDAVSININPSNTDDIVGEFSRGDAARVDEAVAAANAVQPDWAAASPQLRHDVLEKASNLITSRKDELGRLLSREEGKTLAGDRRDHARRTGVQIFAVRPIRNTGDAIASIRPGIDVTVEREAVGTIGLITPLEFSHCHPGLEAGTSAGLWRCGCDETG